MVKLLGNGQKELMKKIIVSYFYVFLWILLSSLVIVFNKYILDKDMYNWPYPLSLTMVHMGFCSAMAFLVVRILKLEDPIGMTRELYLSSIVPIGALYALSLWLSNSAYIFLSVSFIQMLKALMPVSVYTIGTLFSKDGFNSRTMLNMLGISFGVAIAAYGEARLDAFGVALQLSAVLFEAARLVLIQILLTSRGISLNPITSLYYVAPCCFAFLSVPWALIEYPSLLASSSSFWPDYLLFGANSACAFALNLAVFLLIGKTSALTMNIAGVAKDWFLIAFSWSVIRDRITPINLIGYILSFLGVCFYNHSKFRALKVRETQRKIAADADDVESRLHLLELKKDDIHSNGKKNASQP